jgi:pullulanase/glycogen debranching enzyme
MEYLNKHSGITVLGTDAIYLETGRPTRKIQPLSHTQIEACLPFYDCFVHPSVILRREDILKIGGYPNSLYAEDYALWIKILFKTDYKMEILPNTLMKYRRGESRPTYRRIQTKSTFELLEKIAKYLNRTTDKSFSATYRRNTSGSRRPKEQEPFAKIRYPETYCIGSTYSMLVFGLNIEEFEYAFQLDGPYDEKKGLRFHKDNILLDPYARAVTGQRHWGERPEGGKDFVYHARVVENNFDWEKSCFLNHPFEDLVIYEMHVRGFTRDASSGVKAPGTFEGLREKIPYLKDLGINAVELMPVFEFDEMEDTRVVDGERLYNYWGYNTVCFFSPERSQFKFP